MLRNTPLSPSLEENISRLKEITGESSDLLLNRFVCGGTDCLLICCEGMVSTQTAAELIFTPLASIPPQPDAAALMSHIRNCMLLSTDRPEVRDFDTLFRLVYSGFMVLLAEGTSLGLGFGVQGYPTRSIGEPSGEGCLMGSHEGFVETVRSNMSLLRRRLKSPQLVMELMTKGKKSRTDICLCYMKDRVPEKLISDIKSSLDDMKLETILSTGYVRPFLEKPGFRLFNATGTTERPDVLCSRLIEGRAALLIDGVPFAVIVPKLFCESFQTLDDYAFKPVYAVFLRWIKYIAFIIAVLLPAFYVAVVMYHPELLNSTLLMLLVEAEREAPLSIVTESLLVLLMYETIREAGIRLPKSVGGAVSVISGLIIGDAAVKSGLVSTPLLTMTALSVLGGLVLPELDPQITLLRLAFLISGAILGLFGIGLLACAVLINICSTETYGFPYTAPLSPFKPSGMGDTAVRIGMRQMQSRDFTVEEYHE